MEGQQSRRAGRAQVAEMQSDMTADMSDSNSTSSSRRSRRNREGADEQLEIKAEGLENTATKAEIATALGKIGLRKPKPRAPKVEAVEEITVDDENTGGLQSANDGFLDDMKPKTATGEGDDFSCWNCNKSLLGYRFVNREGHPYCVNCYHDLFANKCEQCKDTITVDAQDLAFKDKHWHDKCFQCSNCSRSLVEQNFGMGKDKETLFCTGCYEREYAPKCNRCDNPFKGGVMKLSWNGGNWHSECFQCANCEDVIGKDSFHPHNNKAFCNKCWDKLYSVKCTKCTDPIKASGVTYRMEPYHRDCFLCSECGDVLAGQRFTVRNDKAICGECFGKKYAHKCYECTLPIKGDSGNRYLMFEEHFWHCECFFCKQCNTSLLGTNFIADQLKNGSLNIYCQPCGFVIKGYTQELSSASVSSNKEKQEIQSSDVSNRGGRRKNVEK